MNILFIHPPQFNLANMPGPEMVFKSSYYSPIGVLYIATYTQAKTEHNVRVFDYEHGYEKYDDIVPLLEEFKPDIVGITGYTFVFYDTLQVCKTVKKVLPNTPIIMGGPHVEAYPEDTFVHPEVDILVKGEGEETFIDLLNHYENGKVLEDIQGIYFRNAKSAVQYTGERPKIKNLDEVPFPNRDLLEANPYYTVFNPIMKEASVISSRGCPYKCNFCNTFEKRYRYRSASNVVAEMKMLQDAGYDYIHFYEDTFNLFEKKVRDFCLEYLKQGLTIEWAFRGRVDVMSEELADLLKRTNCRRAYYGVESGSDEILKTIGKKINIAQVERAFELTKNAGIEILGYFMIGFPDETPAMIEHTIRTAIKLDPTYMQVLITTPLPGTVLYKNAVDEGAIPGDYFKEYVRSPTPVFKMYSWNRFLDEEQLVTYSKKFYRKFYFRPSYLLRSLRDAIAQGVFFRKAAAGLQLGKFLVLGGSKTT